MNDKIRQLFYDKNYEEAITEIKTLLQDDNENSDLWYQLFLAENGDYFSTNFEEGYSNELSFNKALENSNRRKNSEYISEYNFYKYVSKFKNLGRLFRYAQYGNIEAVYNIIEGFNLEGFYVEESEEKEFYSNLDFIVYTAAGDNELDLCILLVNLLYTKLQTKDCLDILNDAIKKAEKSNTFLSPYAVLNSYEQIYTSLEALYNNSLGNEEKDSVNIEKVLYRVRILLENMEYDKANELLEKLLNEEPNNPMVNLYKSMTYFGFAKEEEFLTYRGELLENYYFKVAYENADKDFKERLQTYIDAGHNNVYYEKGIHQFRRKYMLKALEHFNKIKGFRETDNYIEQICSGIYNDAMNYWNLHDYQNAIAKLKQIPGYKDSDELIVKIDNQEKEEIRKAELAEKERLKVANKKSNRAKVITTITSIYTLIIASIMSIYILLRGSILMAELPFLREIFEFIGPLFLDQSKITSLTGVFIIQTVVCIIVEISSRHLKDGKQFRPLMISYLPFMLYTIFAQDLMLPESLSVYQSNSIMFLILICIITSIVTKNFKSFPLFLAVFIGFETFGLQTFANNGMIPYYGPVDFWTGILYYSPYILCMLVSLICYRKLTMGRSLFKGFIGILILFNMLSRVLNYSVTFANFNYQSAIYADILGLIILLNGCKYQNDSFDTKMYKTHLILRLINILLISILVMTESERIIANFSDMVIYPIYLYTLVSIIIGFLIYARNKEAGHIITILATIISLTFICKFGAACFECGYVESCNGGITKNNDTADWINFGLFVLYGFITSLLNPYAREGMIEGFKAGVK